jgi:hypothetical protein
MAFDGVLRSAFAWSTFSFKSAGQNAELLGFFSGSSSELDGVVAGNSSAVDVTSVKEDSPDRMDGVEVLEWKGERKARC